MSSTTSSTNNSAANSANFFTPISKSCSVPDIHKNAELEEVVGGNSKINHLNGENTDKKGNNTNTNLLLTNSDSTESAIASSPAGSLEQFEVSGFNNLILPLTPDDNADSING